MPLAWNDQFFYLCMLLHCALRGAARRIAQRNHKHSGELAACTASSKHMYVKIDNQAENLAGEKK